MNMPNRLTVLRILLSFVFMFLLFCPGLLCKILALLVFLLASVTDFYDGYIARKYNLITDLGKILDPIADKILVLAAFLAFVEMGIVPGWMVVIIIFRELLITGIRFSAVNKGKILAAGKAGKHKTVSQMVAIGIILAYLILKEGSRTITGQWPAVAECYAQTIINVFMVITIFLTVWSGLTYVQQNQIIFRHGRDVE